MGATTMPSEVEEVIAKWETVSSAAHESVANKKKERPPGYGIHEPPMIKHVYLHDIHPAPADHLFKI